MPRLLSFRDSIVAHRFFACAVIFVLALLLRASFGGVYYEPILDDTVQYLLYPTSLDYGELIAREGMFSSRPLCISARWLPCEGIPLAFSIKNREQLYRFPLYTGWGM